MVFWDAVHYTGDLFKAITPDTSTVKRAGGVTHRYTSATLTKIGQLVGIQKLTPYLPDDENRAQIGRFTATFAKNAGKYAVYEGFKHIPGATVASKLISDTMLEVKQETNKDKMKSTSQPKAESSTQSSELTSQNAVEGVSEKTRVAHSRM